MVGLLSRFSRCIAGISWMHHTDLLSTAHQFRGAFRWVNPTGLLCHRPMSSGGVFPLIARALRRIPPSCFGIFVIVGTMVNGFPTAPISSSHGTDTNVERSLVRLPATLRTLSARYQGDSLWQAASGLVLHTADFYLDHPDINSLSAPSSDGLTEARACERIVFATTFAYGLTGDVRYAHRAIDELDLLSSRTKTGRYTYPAWYDGQNLLSVAEMATCFALGYTWNKSLMTSKDRKQVLARLASAALAPVTRPPTGRGTDSTVLASFFSPSGSRFSGGTYARSNWNGVVNSGLSLAALLVHNDPDAPTDGASRIYRRILQAFNAYVPSALHRMSPSDPREVQFGGVWDESLNYYSYFTTYLALFFATYQDQVGRPCPMQSDIVLKQGAQFFVAMTGPSHLQFNYGDDNLAISYVPISYFAYVLHRADLVQATDDFLRWYIPSHSAHPERVDRFFPFYLLWYEPHPAGHPLADQPLASVFRGENGDFFSARTSWTDPDALFIAAKGGRPAATHAKMDAGTFVLEAMGERWTFDIGGYGNYELYHYFDIPDARSYAGRWQYFVNNNLSQNTLTFYDSSGNAELQNADGKGIISDYNLGFPGTTVVFDLSSIYRGSVSHETRMFRIDSPRSLWIQDDFTPTASTSKVRWAAVFCKGSNSTDTMVVESSQATMKKGMHEAVWTIERPKNARFVVESVNPYDTMNYHETLTAREANAKNGQSEALNMGDLSRCSRLAVYANPREDHSFQLHFFVRK